MSSYNKPRIVTKIANADLSAKQYHFAKYTAAKDGKEISISGSGDKAVGVIMNKPGLNDDAEVAKFGGGALVKLAEAVSAGNSIKSDANGQGVLGTIGTFCPAIAEEDGVIGDVISVDLFPHYVPDGV